MYNKDSQALNNNYFFVLTVVFKPYYTLLYNVIINNKNKGNENEHD